MMDNKKYIDKVIVHLVKGTKIDNNNNLTSLPFFVPQYFLPAFTPSYPSYFFSSYCKNTFGLTEDEIKYVWKEYKDNMLEKIHQ